MDDSDDLGTSSGEETKKALIRAQMFDQCLILSLNFAEYTDIVDNSSTKFVGFMHLETLMKQFARLRDPIEIIIIPRVFRRSGHRCFY